MVSREATCNLSISIYNIRIDFFPVILKTNERPIGSSGYYDSTVDIDSSEIYKLKPATAKSREYGPFSNGVRILCAFRDMSVSSSSSNSSSDFKWDGSWFGHPGNELIDLV